MISARYLDPTARTVDHSLLGWLLTELPAALSLRLATGYVSADILDWLEEPIEGLRNRGGTATAIVGSNGGATSAADIERLYTVFGDGLFVEYAEGGIFHPKVFAVEHTDRVAALIGSANLTPSGSLVNVEASIVVETDQVGPPPEEPLGSIIESIDPSRYPNATQITDQSVITNLKSLGVIDRIQRKTPTQTSTASRQQRRRRYRAGIQRRLGVTGIPTPTRRRVVSAPAPPLMTPVPPGAVSYCGLLFSSNDLKLVGTREISVSSGIRDWAASVLGRNVQPGEGTLFDMEIDARLAASPLNVFRTPEPVRIWAAGSSGGTHQDVRLVLGTRLRAELDDEAAVVAGEPVSYGSIGVFELPPDPRTQPVRLTVFLPDDPEYNPIHGLLGRSGREQKLHFRTANRPPELAPWP